MDSYGHYDDDDDDDISNSCRTTVGLPTAVDLTKYANRYFVGQPLFVTIVGTTNVCPFSKHLSAYLGQQLLERQLLEQ